MIHGGAVSYEFVAALRHQNANLSRRDKSLAPARTHGNSALGNYARPMRRLSGPMRASSKQDVSLVDGTCVDGIRRRGRVTASIPQVFSAIAVGFLKGEYH